MARNQHTFAKRQREIEKKRKADEKRAKRLQRKQGLEPAPDPAGPDAPDADPAGDKTSEDDVS